MYPWQKDSGFFFRMRIPAERVATPVQLPCVWGWRIGGVHTQPNGRLCEETGGCRNARLLALVETSGLEPNLLKLDLEERMSVMIFDLWNKVGKDLPPVWLDDDTRLLKDLFHVLHGSATFVDFGYRQSLIQFCVEIVVGKPGFVPGFAACRGRRNLHRRLPEIRLSHGTGISSWFQHEVRRRQPDPRGGGCLTTSLLALTKTAALSDSKRLTNQVIGIARPFAIACSVVREGEIPPFSTLDSMPIDRFVAAARSLTFMPCRVRKARTSRPIALCKNGSLALVTAIVFWLLCDAVA